MAAAQKTLSRLPRVLSIQSHVVHGFAGNRSVVLPLQLNDFEVDNINTVQKCNHSGYLRAGGQFTGTVLSIQDFKDIIEGLRRNNLLYEYDYIMTGYISSKELLVEVAKTVKEIKEKSARKVKYLCDPVMGDIWPGIEGTRGAMYVPQDLLPAYKSHILPLADVICPNQCELELLMNGTEIHSDEDMVKCLRDNFEGKFVFVTSNLSLESETIVGYVKSENGDCYKFTVPRYPCSMVGTGDATAANLLAMMHHGKEKNIAEIVNSVLFTMNHVVDTTFRYYNQQITKNPGMCEVGKHDAKELQLVRCQKEIRFDSKKVTKKFDIEKLTI